MHALRRERESLPLSFLGSSSHLKSFPTPTVLKAEGRDLLDPNVMLGIKCKGLSLGCAAVIDGFYIYSPNIR